MYYAFDYCKYLQQSCMLVNTQRTDVHLCKICLHTAICTIPIDINYICILERIYYSKEEEGT